MPDKLLSADPAAGVLLSNDANAGSVAQASTASISPSIAQAASATVPLVKAGAEQLATNPNAWKVGKVIGETIGGVTGFLKGGPLGAAGGMWVGGKAGWRLTNAAQKLAMPVYKALKAAEPFATPLSAIASEGEALEHLNSPEGFAQLAKQMNPPSRARLLEHFKDQPAYVSAIKNAIGRK